MTNTRDDEPLSNEATAQDSLRRTVREAYARVAAADDAGDCCGEASGCCGVSDDVSINTLISTRLGYSAQDRSAVPTGADMGLGCGNPGAIAALQPGEVVVDLGSGGGFDCFLAADAVGASGRVIGVDMTPDMISKARGNAEKTGLKNVEFRLGEIENLPVADAVADSVISNCVINLSPAKEQVFHEAFRVLKHGGRLAISDVVAISALPDDVKKNLDVHCGCVAGAAKVTEIEEMLNRAGFAKITVAVQDDSDQFIRDWFPGSGVETHVRSAIITAYK